jgi:hypothetical protein
MASGDMGTQVTDSSIFTSGECFMTQITRIIAAMLVVLVFMSGEITAQRRFTVKEYLRKLEYYQYANVSIFEADSATTARFREAFTPLMPKSAVEEAAERECGASEKIIALVKKKQFIPASLLTSNTAACQQMVEYAKRVTKENEERIGRVFIVSVKYKSGEEPIILGSTAIRTGTFIQQSDPEFLENSLNWTVDTGTLNKRELQNFATQEIRDGERGSIQKPLGKTMVEHCAASIKQGIFKDVTPSLRPHFSPEVAYLAKKGVFAVQPRGILPLPISLATLPSEQIALSVIDNDALPYLTRWQILDQGLVALARNYFYQIGKFATDTVVIVTGKVKKNGKYQIHELRCGDEVVTHNEIDRTMVQGLVDKLSEPVRDENEEVYCHDALTVAFEELPLPINIDDILAKQQREQEPSTIKRTVKTKANTVKPRSKQVHKN